MVETFILDPIAQLSNRNYLWASSAFHFAFANYHWGRKSSLNLTIAEETLCNVSLMGCNFWGEITSSMHQRFTHALLYSKVLRLFIALRQFNLPYNCMQDAFRLRFQKVNRPSTHIAHYSGAFLAHSVWRCINFQISLYAALQVSKSDALVHRCIPLSQV